MPYPPELIPQPNYRYLSCPEDIAERALLRKHHLPPEQFFDELTDRPAEEEYLEKFSKNIKDLSTSLLGTFQPEHYSFVLDELTPARREYLIFQRWPLGEDVRLPPDDEEWIYRTPATLYHLLVAEVDGLNFDFEYLKKKYPATLKVVHTPCRANYWHCSVRVFDDTGVDIAGRYPHPTKKKLNKRDKTILKEARLSIMNLVRRGVPAAAPIPREVYRI